MKQIFYIIMVLVLVVVIGTLFIINQQEPKSGVLETKILQNLTPQTSKGDSIVIDKRISAGSALGSECQNISYLEEKADYIIEAGVSNIDVNQTTNTKTINLGIVAWLKGNKNTNSLQILTSTAEHGESPTFEENGIYKIYLWELNNKLYFVCEFAGVIDLEYRGWYCHETDGHRNWFEKGSVTVYSDGQIYGPYYDSCAGDTLLDEVGCSNEQKFVISELYLCENGCSEGACIE